MGGPVQKILEPITEIVEEVAEPAIDVTGETAETVTEVAEPVTDVVQEAVETVAQTPETILDVAQPALDLTTTIVEEVGQPVAEVGGDDPNAGLARGRRTPTRSKKPGAAGTLLEGGGVLYE